MHHHARRPSPLPAEANRVFARPWSRLVLAVFMASWTVALGLLALAPTGDELAPALLVAIGVGSVSGLGLASWVVASALADPGP